MNLKPDIFTNEPDDWGSLNHAPFIVHHGLSSHPLFQLDALMAMAEGVARRGDMSKVGLSIDASKDETVPHPDVPIMDKLRYAFGHVGGEGIRIKLSNLEDLSDDYRRVLDRGIDEIEALCGRPIRPDLQFSGLTAFVSSPHTVTPYHFDHDTNFLMQVRGEKEVRLFDQTNREVVTEAEIEKFYWGAPFAGTFNEYKLDHSRRFIICPGTAVHHPPLAPHLITNGDQMSISISLWYSLTPQADLARVYQANFLMRKLGLKPSSPDMSAPGDRMKYRLFNALVRKGATSFDEVLFSGVERIKQPLRAARDLGRRWRGQA